jgi:hypothetical protein
MGSKQALTNQLNRNLQKERTTPQKAISTETEAERLGYF